MSSPVVWRRSNDAVPHRVAEFHEDWRCMGWRTATRWIGEGEMTFTVKAPLVSTELLSKHQRRIRGWHEADSEPSRVGKATRPLGSGTGNEGRGPVPMSLGERWPCNGRAIDRAEAHAR